MPPTDQLAAPGDVPPEPIAELFYSRCSLADLEFLSAYPVLFWAMLRTIKPKPDRKQATLQQDISPVLQEAA